MQLTSHTIKEGRAIPAINALGVRAEGFNAMFVPVPLPAGAQPGPNRSPHLVWSGEPSGTQSYVITCVDEDALTAPSERDQPGSTVPYSAPRSEFVHWVLADVPAMLHEMREGADADGLTPHGKPPGKTAHGIRGLNDYTRRFQDDEQLSGEYAGYDGPWPPINDERAHRYVFTVYALDVPSLGLSEPFTLSDVRQAMEGHVLDEASLHAYYAIYDEAH